MDPGALEIVAAVERTHWWYRARRRILHGVLDRELEGGRPRGGSVLDYGCGTGANLPVVLRCGTVTGCDVSPLALDFARRRGGYSRLLAADGTELPFRDGSFDWLFALDILEHLDDAAAAREILRVLRPGGRALITVPAFPTLWGTQDDASHHLRRYRRGELPARLRAAGLEIRFASHLNMLLLLPIWIARRTIRALQLPVKSENTLHPGWANPVLEWIFGLEAHLVPRVALPFGVSLLCVAARRSHAVR